MMGCSLDSWKIATPKFFKKVARNIASIPGGRHNLAGNEELGISLEIVLVEIGFFANPIHVGQIRQVTSIGALNPSREQQEDNRLPPILGIRKNRVIRRNLYGYLFVHELPNRIRQSYCFHKTNFQNL